MAASCPSHYDFVLLFPSPLGDTMIRSGFLSQTRVAERGLLHGGEGHREPLISNMPLACCV